MIYIGKSSKLELLLNTAILSLNLPLGRLSPYFAMSVCLCHWPGPRTEWTGDFWSKSVSQNLQNLETLFFLKVGHFFGLIFFWVFVVHRQVPQDKILFLGKPEKYFFLILIHYNILSASIGPHQCFGVCFLFAVGMAIKQL